MPESDATRYVVFESPEDQYRSGVENWRRYMVETQGQRMEGGADLSMDKRIIHSHSNEGCRINTHLTNTPLCAFLCVCLSTAWPFQNWLGSGVSTDRLHISVCSMKAYL